MKCSCCEKDAVYKCNVCGKLVCSEHTRLRTICPSCSKTNTLRFSIGKITPDEKAKIRELVKCFWGEEEQLTFDRKFMVSELPAYTAKIGKEIAGFASFTEIDDALIILALGVPPQFQNASIGRRLIEQVEKEARKLKKKRLLVSTSNDDLPALAFYQLLGFQIYEVKPNVIAEKHGEIHEGIGGLPIRDEIRLRKILN
ncbi:MAG TPA: GNAT family N-acetyltransferase [Candidatus Bathyarchaeia archaeon]|jgi:ribosomal protein S18 acetylase RimI-like enzyme|nr:GNAT family N-acetyltransferase [Candidatus Bathyarchaeia archaeon]